MKKLLPATREYVCRYCGQEISESYASWKKKSQKDKRHCPDCLKKRAIAKQTKAEMAHENPFKYYI